MTIFSDDISTQIEAGLMNTALDLIVACNENIENLTDEEELAKIQGIIEGYGPNYGDLILALATGMGSYMIPEGAAAGFASLTAYADAMRGDIPRVVDEINAEEAARESRRD